MGCMVQYYNMSYDFFAPNLVSVSKKCRNVTPKMFFLQKVVSDNVRIKLTFLLLHIHTCEHVSLASFSKKCRNVTQKFHNRLQKGVWDTVWINWTFLLLHIHCFMFWSSNFRVIFFSLWKPHETIFHCGSKNWFFFHCTLFYPPPPPRCCLSCLKRDRQGFLGKRHAQNHSCFFLDMENSFFKGTVQWISCL
jgi:hypothetical protein